MGHPRILDDNLLIYLVWRIGRIRFSSCQLRAGWDIGAKLSICLSVHSVACEQFVELCISL